MNDEHKILCYSFSIASTSLHFHVACIVRLHVNLHYEFERVFLPISCGFLINCGHVLIFICLSSFEISIKIFYLKQLIDFEAFSFLRQILFLLSISFHLFQISIFHSLSPHFFYSTSTLGHNLSCLMNYLGSVILIFFILHQEHYL